MINEFIIGIINKTTVNGEEYQKIIDEFNRYLENKEIKGKVPSKKILFDAVEILRWGFGFKLKTGNEESSWNKMIQYMKNSMKGVLGVKRRFSIWIIIKKNLLNGTMQLIGKPLQK